MSRFLSLALCLVCVPAFADLEIFEDTTLYSIPGDYVLVHGDATLTLAEGPNGEIPSTFSVRLVDTASLVMEAGNITQLTFDRVLNCDYEERCHRSQQASISNSTVQNILVYHTVTADITLSDSEFNSISSGPLLSKLSVSYSDSFLADRYGHLDGNFGRISFSAPGASYEAIGNGRFEFLYTDPDGVQESPFFAAEGEWFFTEAKRVSITPTDRPLISGDVNGDGQVGIADLNEVRNNFGRPIFPSGTPLGDMAPYNVVADIADLNAVRNNFGSSLVQPVPEPSAFIMALAGIALSCTRGQLLNLLRQPKPLP